MILPSVPGGIPLRYAAPRLSKKWLAPLFRGVHSSLAPTARPGSYARKPLLRKAFCGFDAHVAKSDQSLRGLRPPNPRGVFRQTAGGIPLRYAAPFVAQGSSPLPRPPWTPVLPRGAAAFCGLRPQNRPAAGLRPAAGGWAAPTRRRPPAGPVAPCPFAAAPPAKPTFFENPIDRSG